MSYNRQLIAHKGGFVQRDLDYKQEHPRRLEVNTNHKEGKRQDLDLACSTGRQELQTACSIWKEKEDSRRSIGKADLSEERRRSSNMQNFRALAKAGWSLAFL